ncbi:MAG: glycoside hydrolase family 97 protein [Pseudoflavonifractor sp.]|nr:glycoside hydrolase family 97 protein [Alloprevotella sp.]MCM1117459.1 glycoside hydrolase family 97 protein [Pseudoflavonifractor sp.]
MRLTFILIALLASLCLHAKTVSIASPSKAISATLDASPSGLSLSASLDGQMVLLPSSIGITLANGTEIGPTKKASVKSRKSVDRMTPSPFYRASEIAERYNEITITLAPDWDIILRAYDDGIAYRFVTKARAPFEIADETASLHFPADASAITPYTNASDTTSIAAQFRNSFENTYTVTPIADMSRGRLSFLPLTVTTPAGCNILISESDLNDYPGMYLLASKDEPATLNALFAPYPKERRQGGHNNLQLLVTETEDYIARVNGPRPFPWRMMIIAGDDKTLAASNLTYLLAEPSKIADTSWIRPGKVAWEWWNDWNITGVPFLSGINNDTYKAYIDFAAKNDIEYVILDEGWAVNLQADLMQIVPEIDLPALIEYAASKGVGIILWAGYHAFDRDMENVCRHYADMGIKGFKVDFMDSDNQLVTDFNHRAAETAARHHLLLDLHGTSKPAGLNRTWPNVLNFEGVYGLEQMKWARDVDMPRNDATIPFIRQAAGPLDYTQGAMNNAAGRNYHPLYNDPMSQGTRAHQVALYMVFDSPLTMLCDTPSNYEREQETTDFLTAIPTVWDETRVIDGKIGQYIVTARRSGNEWWIGGITDSSPRSLAIDLSFIPGIGQASTELFADGPNAHRNGRDYSLAPASLEDNTLKIHLAPGGGFALHVKP